MLSRVFRGLARGEHASSPIAVTLWCKADCCLCDRAEVILEKLAREYSLKIDKHDIGADPVAFDRYRYVIPVIEIEGGQRFEGKITEFWLRRALDQRLGE